MAGDLDTVKYTYPVPVQISHDAYRAYLDVVDATACARIRNAMVHADVPGAVELRSRFRVGVLYSKFRFLSVLPFVCCLVFVRLQRRWNSTVSLWRDWCNCDDVTGAFGLPCICGIGL